MPRPNIDRRAAAKDYIDGRSTLPGDELEFLGGLRRDREFELGRRVAKKLLGEGRDESTEPRMLLFQAFFTFRDRSLDDERRWREAKGLLGELTTKSGEVVDEPTRDEASDLGKAIDRSVLVHTARQILGGKVEPEEDLAALAKNLRKVDAFGEARRLYGKALEQAGPNHPDAESLRQQRALCTYKDPDVPTTERLDRALLLLAGTEKGSDPEAAREDAEKILDRSRDPETLGLAGAIFKRKWEAEGRKGDLEKSLDYYRTGHELDMRLANHEAIAAAGRVGAGLLDLEIEIAATHKFGYPGINAAFILDQLASLEAGDSRRAEAAEIRRTLADYLTALLRVDPGGRAREGLGKVDLAGQMWWIQMTIAEACFGLGRFEQARETIEEARRPDEGRYVPPAWELASTAQQLAKLARAQGIDLRGATGGASEPVAALRALVDEPAAFDNVLRGKLGLGLSGGGFRASLFHIGVLAKLAELDLLRHVEVLSCVSGGSILGAHYYLEVRNLLQTIEDGQLGAADYVRVVENIVRDFSRGIQENVRTRAIGNPMAALRMLASPGYSGSVRLGELYEKLLFSRVRDGEGHEKRWLNDLFVEPKGESLLFKPRSDNWRRANQVPMLVLNATTLNTGHNWQFTASWMGEPPPVSAEELDGKVRLRRMYYHQAPLKHRRVRLGTAVAASACVPGLFEPVEMHGLFPDYTVRLADGGVHDNQGVASLLDQDCSVLLVSDASGQITTEPQTGGGTVKPLLRSTTVSMERVREAQLRELQVRGRAGRLSHQLTVHLKQDLNPRHLDWIECPDPAEAGDDALPPWRRGVLTRYGVRRDLQASLARMRTDLDSFSDAEAYALMTSGYLMTGHAADRSFKGLAGKAKKHDWEFLQKAEAAMTTQSSSPGYLNLKSNLEVSGQSAFRAFRLAPLRSFGALLVIVAVAVGLVLGLARLLPDAPWRWIGIAGVTALVLVGLPKLLMGWRQPLRSLFQMVIASAATALGWLIALVEIRVFDRMFLRRGKL